MASKCREIAIVFLVFVGGCNKADQHEHKNQRFGQIQEEPVGRIQEQPRLPATKKWPRDLLAGPAEISLTVDELGKEEDDNEKATQLKYKEKIIELTGVLKGINRNVFLNPEISMIGEKEKNTLVFVESIDRETWKRALPGQRVRLKVVYFHRGPGWAVKLYGGPFLEVKDEPNPTVSVQELANEFELDPMAFEAKYGLYKCNAIVTGEVVKAAMGDSVNSGPEMYLKISPERTLKCLPDAVSLQGVKPGMRLKLSGWCIRDAENRNEIIIGDCLVLGILN